MAKTSAPMKPSVKAAQNKVAQQQPKSSEAPKYPHVVAHIHTKDWEALKAATGLDIYRPPLTVEDAKRILGWESENEYVAKIKSVDRDANEDDARKIFGNEFFDTDMNGDRYRLRNNMGNRPWSKDVSKGYMNDILKRYWRLNGETLIIGVNGRVLSGQHRLIGMIYAEQERTAPEKGEGARVGIAAHWEDYWKEPITLECVVVYGIPETSDITRTLDNVKSRTLSDIIYADTNIFGDYKPVERKVVARMLDFAVKMLWARTGEKKDPWTLKQTHSESLDFVNRHPKLVECIRHIYEENKGEKGLIKNYTYPGHAAALMYMMGCAGTKEEKLQDYFALRGTATPPSEKQLDFGNFKKAKMFWSDIARDAPELVNLRDARYPMPNDPADSYTGMVFSPEETLQGNDHQKWGTLIKAWNYYVKDETVDRLELTYESHPLDPNEPEPTVWVHRQKEYPTIRDSIDIGNPPPAPKEPKAKSTPNADETDTPDAMEEVSEEEADNKAQQAQTNQVTMRQAWEKDKKDFAGHIILNKSYSGNYVAYFDDAELVAPLTGRKALTDANGVTRCVFGPNDVEEACRTITEAGHHILIAENDENKKRVIRPWGEDVTDNTDEVDEESSGEEESAEPDPKDNDENGNPPPTPAPQANASSQQQPTQKKVFVKRK